MQIYLYITTKHSLHIRVSRMCLIQKLAKYENDFFHSKIFDYHLFSINWSSIKLFNIPLIPLGQTILPPIKRWRVPTIKIITLYLSTSIYISLSLSIPLPLYLSLCLSLSISLYPFSFTHWYLCLSFYPSVLHAFYLFLFLTFFVKHTHSFFL